MKNVFYFILFFSLKTNAFVCKDRLPDFFFFRFLLLLFKKKKTQKFAASRTKLDYQLKRLSLSLLFYRRWYAQFHNLNIPSGFQLLFFTDIPFSLSVLVFFSLHRFYWNFKSDAICSRAFLNYNILNKYPGFIICVRIDCHRDAKYKKKHKTNKKKRKYLLWGFFFSLHAFPLTSTTVTVWLVM